MSLTLKVLLCTISPSFYVNSFLIHINQFTLNMFCVQNDKWIQRTKGNNILKKTEFYEVFLSEIKQVTSDMLGFLSRGSEDESP